MSSVVVDTDVISFQFKRDSRAVRYDPYLAGNTLVLSFMTVAELDRWSLQHRWGKQRCQRLEQHLRNFVVVFADRNLCRWWAEACERASKNGFVISATDAWIAATALALDVPLVTHNEGDYQGIDGLSILRRRREQIVSQSRESHDFRFSPWH